ncbi:hypothetical protein B7494_g3572 [Chlorociboria aeruginascens]|nr:hypothetical protein B7494_g3572 [Chlorociboria aeruginascens]
MDLKVVGELWEYVINVHFKEVAEEDKVRALMTRFANDPNEKVKVGNEEAAMVQVQVPEESNEGSESVDGSLPGESVEVEEVSKAVNVEQEARLKMEFDNSDDREEDDDISETGSRSHDWDENLEYGGGSEEGELSDNGEGRVSLERPHTDFREEAYWSHFGSSQSPSRHTLKRPRFEEQIEKGKSKVEPSFQLYEENSASTQFYSQETAIIISGIRDSDIRADMKIIDLLLDLQPISLQMGSEFPPARQQELITEFGIAFNFALVTMRSVTSQHMALRLINVTAGLRDSKIRGWKAQEYSPKPVFKEGPRLREPLEAKYSQPNRNYTSFHPDPPIPVHKPVPTSTSTSTSKTSKRQRKRWIQVLANLASAVATARSQLKGPNLEIFEELIAKPKPGDDISRKIDEWVKGA